MATKKTENKQEKPTKSVEEFIENVNKKDKMNGHKITFGFTKRKR